MTTAAERLINLALFLASSRGYVTAEQVRAEVDGYPVDQDEAAFIRMFERDKDDLRAAGLDILSDTEGRYRLDAQGTFAASLTLSGSEAAALRLVAAAFADDPTFPFAEDLRLALAKLDGSGDFHEPDRFVSLAENAADAQGDLVAQLDAAVSARKRAVFDYTNARGEHKHHEVEPYGLFVRGGLWYLVARDIELDEIRVYLISRMSDPIVSSARPKSPDYVVPEGFDVASFVGLPFQYGGQPGTAVIRFDPSSAWRAHAFAAMSGVVQDEEDGSATWTVEFRDADGLRSWILKNGPGLRILQPETEAEQLRVDLEGVARAHD